MDSTISFSPKVQSPAPAASVPAPTTAPADSVAPSQGNSDLADRLKALRAQAAHTIKKQAEMVRDTAAEHPVATLVTVSAASAGAGYLAGMHHQKTVAALHRIEPKEVAREVAKDAGLMAAGAAIKYWLDQKQG